MNETVIYLNDGWLFVRHERLYQKLPTILFIHGLGESGLSFNEAFDFTDLENYALIVPDLLGYGRSSHAFDNDYGRTSQTRRLWNLIDNLGVESFFIVGHSMGGDLGTFMAASDHEKRIKGFVNIEGDLTPHDIFFSNKVVSAAERGDFFRWFEKDFNEDLVLNKWGNMWSSCRRYYASLMFCRPEAFLANSTEIFQKNQPLPGRKECLTGITYAGLNIPKVYCWGSESLSKGTLDFLESACLQHKKFEPAFHWPMIDRADEFYPFVSNFLGSIS
jgi:pimeloyl-ACP methyl ester carboxylesterase